VYATGRADERSALPTRAGGSGEAEERAADASIAAATISADDGNAGGGRPGPQPDNIMRYKSFFTHSGNDPTQKSDVTELFNSLLPRRVYIMYAQASCATCDFSLSLMGRGLIIS
jgi:hypothetical protein